MVKLNSRHRLWLLLVLAHARLVLFEKINHARRIITAVNARIIMICDMKSKNGIPLNAVSMTITLPKLSGYISSIMPTSMKPVPTIIEPKRMKRNERKQRKGGICPGS